MTARAVSVLALSLLAHLGALALLNPVHASVSSREPEPVEFELAVIAPPEPPPAPPEPETTSEPEQPDPATTPAPPLPSQPRPRQEPEPARPSPPSPSPSTPDSAAPTVPSPTVPYPSAPNRDKDRKLDPAEAARALVLSQQQLSDERFQPADKPDRMRGGDIDAMLAEYGTKRYVTKREAPELKRQKNGTFRFVGDNIVATVDRDGSVKFGRQRKTFHRDGANVGARFDLTTHYLRKRGEDPDRAEKKWFLESTEEFREKLLTQWRAEQLALSLRRLNAHLEKIWGDVSLSRDEKSRKIRRMYRNTALDDAGQAARTAIATFVDERMPWVVLDRASSNTDVP